MTFDPPLLHPNSEPRDAFYLHLHPHLAPILLPVHLLPCTITRYSPPARALLSRR